MNHNIFLGAVERIAKTGKPGARIRPFLQASPNKKSWIAVDEEFLNSGVVSWWDPPPEISEQKLWYFQVEPSWTFDPTNPQHDAYLVKKGTSIPAQELITVAEVDDLEDARLLLMQSGVPLEQCASRRLFLRDRSGLTTGPIEFTIRDGRLYLNERDTPLPLYQSPADLACGEWNGHLLLPVEPSLQRVGEVDFSANPVFLKHILREIRDTPSDFFAAANLTKKLISQYASIFDKAILTEANALRLKRLRRLSERATTGIELGEAAISDLLSLPVVKELISSAKDDAVRHALKEGSDALTELSKKRQILDGEVAELRAEAGRLHDAIAATMKEQNDLLAGFDARVHDKFQEVGRNATSFLSEVAVIRAALSKSEPSNPRIISSESTGARSGVAPVAPDQVLSVLRSRFDGRGLGCISPSLLLSSWASGYVPVLFGVLTRDILHLASEALFGGALHVANLGPGMTSASDLLGVPTASRFGVSTIGEVAESVGSSDDIAVLVLDNLNLAQIDSLVLPLLRPYAEFHSQRPSEEAPPQYPTPAGMWPRNLLLAGVLIDSPLSLPLSREIWAYASLVDASRRRICPTAKTSESGADDDFLRLPFGTWSDWLRSVTPDVTADIDLIAVYLTHKVESSSLVKRMSRRLASAIDKTAHGLSQEKRAGLLIEALLPYLLSRDVAPNAILDDAPIEVSTDDAFIQVVTEHFERWGVEVR